MNKHFIGREAEIQQLNDIVNSGKAEFVAVYGRRRVGKTYLIQQFFEGKFAFSATGIIDGKREEQLFSFTASLSTPDMKASVRKNGLKPLKC